MTIERCRNEQLRAAKYMIDNGELADDARGAKLGMADWLGEELMIELEQKKDYSDFLQSKQWSHKSVGFQCDDISTVLFPFQRDIVRWALNRGRAAIFADCGLGKGLQSLEWARHVNVHTGMPTITFAPLAVAQQFKRESEKLGISHLVKICKDGSEIHRGLNIANYERLHLFDPSKFGGIVCDESSIMKSQDGKTRKALLDFASCINFRLACTATPSPNDYVELGSHAEFLGVMRSVEMLSLFFVHDGGDTSKWRLKGHAQTAFWKWVCSWAVAIRKPSDIGYEDGGFVLPELRMHQVTVAATEPTDGYLFPVEAQTLEERRDARKSTISQRVKVCADMVNACNEPWLVWCNLNAESSAIEDAIHDAVEITGSDDVADKEDRLLGFIDESYRVLVTKPMIAGFGLNLQHCSKMAFVGLSDSYEQLYQAIRRCWRFGQKKEVDVYVITSELEGAVVRNIERKEKQAMEMMDEMVKHMQTEMQKQVRGLSRETDEYETETKRGKGWTIRLGDCIDGLTNLESETIDYSVFSPPFASLYTYSNSDRDMGNCTEAQFWEHISFLIPQLYRVLKPGRLLSFHCMNIPSTKERDGFIGIKDFRGALVTAFNQAGFIFHSEVCIWKDPVTAMQRTKAIGLLYKQLRKDSALSRQGIPDYLVTMRKSGVNPDPITKTHESFPVDRWQRYASPVWMDINPNDTLQKESAREDEDERHICPLQLQVIERAVELWTNPGDIVLSPFAGIGSEGYVSVKMERQFIGFELKRSYYEQAARNLKNAEVAQTGLFSDLE